MIRNIFTVLSLAAWCFVQGQDISVLRNSIDVYGNTHLLGSSKFNAMVGAMGAMGGDVSAMHVNPAAVGVAITGDISATLNILANKNTSAMHGSEFGYKISGTGLGQVGGLLVFEPSRSSSWKFFNLGFSYSTRNVEDYVETRVGHDKINFTMDNGETLIFKRHAYDRAGSVSKMNFGLGANYNNKMYFGMGFNFSTSNIEQVDRAQLSLLSTGKSEFYNKQYTPFFEEGAGFSASFGVIAKLTNQFRLGWSLETPTWWAIDRVYDYYGKDSKDDGTYSEPRRYTSPMKTTLSTAYVPNKNFALNVDYTFGLSKPKFSSMDSGARKEFEEFYSQNYNNFSEFRFGAEYRYQQFRFRGGYAFRNSPFKSGTMDTFTRDGMASQQNFKDYILGKQQRLGLGLGYDFKSFYLDVAYNRISSHYNNPFLRGSAEAGTEYYAGTFYFANNTATVSTVDNSKHLWTFSLGWRF